MKDWLVEVRFDANDDAGKVLSGVLNVLIDNCPDATSAAAIAGSHVRRYFGERKVGIISAKAQENEVE